MKIRLLSFFLACAALGRAQVPVPPNQWTELTPGGYSIYRTQGWEKAWYINHPVLGPGGCFLANFLEISSEPNRSMMCFSWKYNWTYIISNQSSWHDVYGAEGGHPVNAQGIDLTTLVSCGGGDYSGGQVSEKPGNRYCFDYVGLTGRNLQVSTHEDYNINLAGGAYDETHGVMVTLGGWSFEGTNEYQQSTGTLSLAVGVNSVGANCTTSPQTGCPDPSITMPSMAFNSNDGQIYLFGGLVGSTLQNTVYSYNQPTHTWQQRSPGGTAPAARQKSVWVYDSAKNVLLLYGGASVLPPTENVLNDTWVLDLNAADCGGNPDGCWSQLTPTASPDLPSSPTFERGYYDPVNDVTVIFTVDGTNHTHVWAFRYVNTGSNAGNTPAPSYAPSPAGYNLSSSDWGERPSLTVSADGSTLYLAWIEGGGTQNWFQPYALSINATSGATTWLGGSYGSMASEYSTLEAEDVEAQYLNGQLWATWHQGNNSAYFDRVNAKYWNGSAWVGGLPGFQNAGGLQQGQSVLTAVGSTVYVGLKENLGGVPMDENLYVAHWNGSGYTSDGGQLNVGTQVDDIAAYSDGSHPCFAWTEVTIANVTSGGVNSTTFTPNTLYAKCLISGAWSQIGGAVNVNPANRDFAVSATYLGGQPYLAFTERSDSGVPKLYIRTYNGSAWVTVAGPLNINSSTGWAFAPSISNDGSSLYVAWDEQAAYGAMPKIYVDKCSTGGACTQLGGALNVDQVNGAGQHPSIAVAVNGPAVAWGELRLGSFRQVYAKQWTGSAWALIGVAVPVASCPVGNTGTVGDTYADSFSVTGGLSPFTWSISSGSLPNGLTLNTSTGGVTGTFIRSGTFPFTGQVVDAVGETASAPCTITVAAGSFPVGTAAAGFKCSGCTVQ